MIINQSHITLMISFSQILITLSLSLSLSLSQIKVILDDYIESVCTYRSFYWQLSLLGLITTAADESLILFFWENRAEISYDSSADSHEISSVFS